MALAVIRSKVVVLLLCIFYLLLLSLLAAGVLCLLLRVGFVGWSAVYDSDISWSYSILKLMFIGPKLVNGSDLVHVVRSNPGPEVIKLFSCSAELSLRGIYPAHKC